MKKLLSIFAASTLIISAPLSVISCKKQKITTGDEFDFVEILRQFISEVTLVFETEIQKAFSDYAWMEEENLPEVLTIENIRSAKENGDFENHESEFYQQLLKLINPLIPVNKINEELMNSVVNDVNYNPVLLDKSTPLKNGIDIEEIVFIDKTDAITIGLQLSSLVFYKDEKGEKSSEVISTKFAFNIFESDDMALDAKEIDDAYIKLLNETIANDIIFESNSGNLENTATLINTGTLIREDLVNKLDSLNTIEGNEAVIISNDLKLVANNEMFVDSSRFSSKVSSSSENKKLYRDAMAGDLGSEEEFLKNIINWSDWVKPNAFFQRNTDTSNFEENALKSYQLWEEKNPTTSTYVNQYNLSYNLSIKKQLQKVIKSQNSQFLIDLEKDYKTIALFGINVNDAKFKIGSSIFDFSNQTIIAKQRTTKENTIELYNDFMISAYNFQKSFLDSEKIGDKYQMNLEVPKEWDLETMKNQKITYDKEIEQQLMTANEKANSFKGDLEFSNIVTSTSAESKQDGININNTHIWINDNGDLWFLRELSITAMYGAMFKSYYFSTKFCDSLNLNIINDLRTMKIPENSYEYKDFFNNLTSPYRFK
ncbi:hypothetical protein [Spiroplasma alleghenense]|uniref:Lipoprotein n=1 Tax=Spiroplasma alleghenense TaxID=216931 RepID=A0A345Z548_9MOLU|nr:hypothetical protein [Spiroplasma alleghenense]AXK51727.1 hypothetical protein SALLE_v1c10570 [Spiroplasma alleghenense]